MDELQRISSLTQFYLENAKIIKETLQGIGCEVFGGEHAPYLWVRFNGKKSWDLFEEFLNKYQRFVEAHPLAGV